MADAVLCVSPHLDDAVLSVGQFMAGWPGCVVYTLFCGAPKKNTPVTTYDERCGFATPEAGLRVRRDEERHALGLLRAVSMTGTAVDHQYRGAGVQIDVPGQADAMAQVIDRVNPIRVLAPLGLLHPDHAATARVCEHVATRMYPKLDWWFYEELPARILDPVAAVAAVGRLQVELGMTVELTPELGRDKVAEKLIALGEYGSQSWAWSMGMVSCPERMWRWVK